MEIVNIPGPIPPYSKNQVLNFQYSVKLSKSLDMSFHQ